MQYIDSLRLVNIFHDIVNNIINRYGLKDYTKFYLAFHNTYILIEIYLLFYNKYFYLVSENFDSEAIINSFPKDIIPTVKTNNIRLDIRLPMEGCEIILRTFGLNQKQGIEMCQTHIDLHESKILNYDIWRPYIDLWCKSFRGLLDLIDDPKPCVVFDDGCVALAEEHHKSLVKYHVNFMEWW